MDLGCAGGFRRGRLEEGGDGGDGGRKRKGWASVLRRGTLRWFGVVVLAGRSREGEGVMILEVWLGRLVRIRRSQDGSGPGFGKVRCGASGRYAALGTFEVVRDCWGKGGG